MNWNLIIGPGVGAIIGYFTNLIAIKMLFRPRKAHYLFGHQVPFTPGVIPKGKARLAKAVADAVTGSLLTGEDLKAKVMSKEIMDKVADKVMEYLNMDIDSILAKFDSDNVEKVKDKIADMLTIAILDSIKNLPLNDLIIRYGGAAIKEKTRGTMLQMFITDGLIASYAEPITNAIKRYIDENGEVLVSHAVKNKMAEITSESCVDLLSRGGMDREKLRDTIIGVYRKIADNAVDRILESLNIGALIENKINDMSNEELEKLILQVMKKELNAIVNLGALIGLVLGFINAFF